MAPKLLDAVHGDRYKWIALTNTTLGVFMATINSSIILISLPAIFRGIGINPLSAGNVGYLLWLLPGPRRQFALVGALGQRICIDPALKLVMVQTALDDTPEVWRLWAAVVGQLGRE